MKVYTIIFNMAYQYKESEMVYKDYSKTHVGDDNPNDIGFPDDKELNRKELYEVLPFINKLSRLSKWDSIASYRHAEILIHDHLPGTIRSHLKVINWLRENKTRRATKPGVSI
jgi:hypothetical protein